MKNFTNNFKQFTSRLSARWLIMALMMLVGTSSAWGWSYKTAKENWTCRGNTGWSSKTIYTTPTGSSTKTGVDVVMMENPGSGFNIIQNDNCSGQQLYIGLTGTASSSTSTIVRATAYWNNGLYSTYTVVIPEGKIYIKPTNGSAVEMTKSRTYSNSSNTTKLLSACTYTASITLSSAKTFDLYATDPGATISNESSMPAAGKPSTVRLNYTGLTSPYQYVKVTYNLITNQITFTEDTPPCTTVNAPNVTSNGPICAGSTATLTLKNRQEGVTYKLNSTTGTTIFTSGNNTYTTPALNANTTYKIYASHASACTNNVEGSVTVTVNAKPKIILTQETETICNGESITLANYIESKTGTVTWYTDQAMTQTAAAKVSPTTNTVYYAKAVNSPCTAATAQLAVTVNNKPAVPTLSADNTSLIGDEKAVFTVGNTVSGLTYTLYNGETPGESQISTGSDLTFKAGGEGSYTVRVTNSCGTSTSTPAVVVTVCTPQTNEFRHANSSYAQQQAQPTYYPGDKAYFVSINNCCLTGTWSANLQKGEEAWYTGLTGGTPRFNMTLTRAGEFTITNMATNGCTPDKNVLVNLNFTVTALSEVTNANGTASGADIALTWNNSANHSNVMVVRYPISETETIPAGGQAYTAGNTLGGGTVVYVGTAGSYTDKNLPAGASYKYYFYTVNNKYYSEGVVLNMSSCPTPAKPQLTASAVTACDGEVTANGYITITNMANYKDDTYTFRLGDRTANPDANGKITISSADNTEYTVTVINSCGNSNSAEVEITINDNTPVITGNTSFQPNGSTTLTSDKGASTTWVALDGGDLNTKTGAAVVFTAKENGTYHVQATYNGCSTTVEIKVQDDLYVWVRRPIKKEKAYDKFYANTTTKGGALYYKEFASKPANATDCNQGGKVADKTCEDKDGYTWDGFVISKTAIENNYYFTVHAANESSKSSNDTHTYLTQFNSPDADLYFVMDETGTGNINGWNINTPVVVRASGDAMFNGNNFADFVPLYVKDANTCIKEVVSFEWQKSASQDGTYSTYKSGKGINNIRTREAGWYRCVVTYGDGKGTATSNSIQVTNTGGTSKSFTSNLPIIMVNTNGVGFPSDKDLTVYPSAKADDLKEKVSVDVIIKLGNEIVYDRKARMNYRGSSSLNFKKKSYAFVSGQDSCVFDKSRHDYVKTKKAKMFNILGDNSYSANDKDWVLYAATPDPSMMRNRLVFDLYQKMRKDDWGVHSKYVELIVDGEYQGVYVFMDKITANENRVNITNPNGFIVKFDKTDKADRIGGYNGKVGDEKTFKTERTGKKDIPTYDTSIDQLFEIEYPEKEDIEDNGDVWEEVYQPIIDRFEEFEEALSLKNYTRVRDLIDYDSWADWFILTEFIKNQDGFRASCIFTYGGNQGDKIKAVPLWDQELSMNNLARVSHGSSSPNGLLITTQSIYDDPFSATFWFNGNKSATINGGLLKDECFVSLVKEKWAEYSGNGGILTEDEIQKMVNKYDDEFVDGGAQEREEAKWPYNGDTRGMTNNNKTIGYFGKNEGQAIDYDDSRDDITAWAGSRVTPLTNALNGLAGEAIIFTLTPTNVETTPWSPVILTVNSPEGYDYSMDFTKLPVDAVVKEGNNTFTIKLPQPSSWVPGGDGSGKSETYSVKATLKVGEETSVCGTKVQNEKESTIVLKETYEDCSGED